MTNYDHKARYYNAGEIETLDVIRAKLGDAGYGDYLLGNIIKYSCRLKWKGNQVRDADKLAWYSMWLHELLIELNKVED